MKDLSLKVSKLWPMLKFFDGQKDRQTEGQTEGQSDYYRAPAQWRGGQTDRRTDRQKDRQKDRVITIGHPPSGGALIIMHIISWPPNLKKNLFFWSVFDASFYQTFCYKITRNYLKFWGRESEQSLILNLNPSPSEKFYVSNGVFLRENKPLLPPLLHIFHHYVEKRRNKEVQTNSHIKMTC